MIRIISISVALLLSAASMAWAAEKVIAAPTASLEAQTGTRMLIDVRHVTEWRRTGVPAGAKEISIHDREGLAGFVARVTQAVGGNKKAPISLICARGVRSSKAAGVLAAAGFTNISDVREGMLGNQKDGPGWLKRNLPIQVCKNC
jgi:rhodanese-related sulfurtransferase